jgi:uncharacterized protein (TIGR02145 family)
MKKIHTILTAVLITASALLPQHTNAQAPQKMSYQAVIRDVNSQLVKSQAVGMQISILQGSATGTAVYVETQTATTNANGLVTIEIGTGTTTDDFSTIDWANGTYFIKTETDPTGGTDYTIIGTSQLLSVPYALYAKTAESIGGIIITENDTAQWLQTLSTSANKISISSGNSITLPDGLTNVPIYTTAEIVALTPENGQAVFNGDENLYQIYNGSEWKAFSANCWPLPTPANAGSNQTFTDGTVSTTLAANTPAVGHGTGKWSIVSGTGGSFDDDTNPTTTFNGTLHEIYTLRWTISTNCSSSTDDVIIAFNQDGAGSTLTDADGNTYNTVWIGNQQWMAENLKVTKTVNGNVIPLITDDTEWSNLGDNNTDSAYCYYSNSTDSLAKYGALYTYAAAKNACPTGWHLPSDAEWTELENYISNDGHSGTEGTALKSTSGWNNSGNGTDNYGFSALPGGFRGSSNGTFNYVGYYGYWWSATGYNSSDAYLRSLDYNNSVVNRHNYGKSNGFSVRCVRD